jgi:hypothetical protein
VFADLPTGQYSLQATKPGYSPGGYGRRRPTGAAQLIVVSDNDRIGDLTIPLWKYATLSGTVTDEAGEPVVDVQVRAMRRVYENGRPQYTTAAAGMAATTDDRGMYRLATLIPGDYLIAIGSTQSTMPMSTVEAARKAAANGTSTDFARELSASGGSTLTAVGLGALASGVAVGDQFFQSSAFSSRVATPPAPGADGRLFVYPMQFYPSATGSAQATVIPVKSGEDRVGIDLQLKPVATSRIAGTVTGPNGPVPHMGLSLIPATTTLISDAFFESATTVTDARGAFVFLGVPSGQYVLRALKMPPRPATPSSGLTTVIQTGSSTVFTGSTPSEAAPTAPQIPQGPTLWANVPVAVDRTDVTGVAVTLQTGFHVGGRLVFDGTAEKPAPDALRRILVLFEPLDDRSSANSTVTRAAIDATGKLSSYELPPGKYYVRVSGTMPGWTFKGAMVGGRDVADEPLDLKGSDVPDLALTFTDHPAVLRGQVRATGGAPDTAALVLVFPVTAASPDFAGAPRRVRSTRVTRSGTYTLNGLPAGDYLVVAVTDESAADFPSATLIRSLARLATRLKVVDGETAQDLTTVVIR